MRLEAFGEVAGVAPADQFAHFDDSACAGEQKVGGRLSAHAGQILQRCQPDVPLEKAHQIAGIDVKLRCQLLQRPRMSHIAFQKPDTFIDCSMGLMVTQPGRGTLQFQTRAQAV